MAGKVAPVVPKDMDDEDWLNVLDALRFAVAAAPSRMSEMRLGSAYHNLRDALPDRIVNQHDDQHKDED